MENSNYDPNEISMNSTTLGIDADLSTTCAAADAATTTNTPKLHNDGKNEGKIRQDIKNEQHTSNEEMINEDEKKMAVVNFHAANLDDNKGQLPIVDQDSHNMVQHGQSIDTNRCDNEEEKKLPTIVDFNSRTDHTDNDEEQAVVKPYQESVMGKVGAPQTCTTNNASQSRVEKRRSKRSERNSERQSKANTASQRREEKRIAKRFVRNTKRQSTTNAASQSREEKRRSKRRERNSERQSTINTASKNREEKRIAKRLVRNADRNLGRPPLTMTSIDDDQVEEIIFNEVAIVGAMARTPSQDISPGTYDFDILTDSNEEDDNYASYSSSEEGMPEDDSTDAPVLQAYMVQDEEDQLLAAAEPMSYENIRRRNVIICFLFAVLSGIVAGISVFVTRRRSITPTDAPSDAPTVVPSSTPTAAPTVSIEGLISLISEISGDEGESLRLTNSPQQRAFKWLKQNNTFIHLYTTERLLQRYALASFFFSTSGEEWITSDNWLSDNDECEWYPNGTLCPFRDNIISQIILPENNLRGSIPPEISLLAFNLTEIDLSGNKIFGSIPSTVGRLTNLVRLRLSENDLTGSIPTELGNASKLEYLDLQLNIISGSIPAIIGSLSKIRLFDITDTLLSGAIPTELGYLTDLEFLSFGRSFLSGSLVSELGYLSQLRTLDLFDAGMTGTLPTEIGLLQNLKILDLRFNELEGSLPAEIGNLSMLEILNLHGNGISGTLPTEIGFLSKLTFWDQTDNGSIRAPIPSEIGNMPELQFLAFRGSHRCALVSEIGKLTKLRILHFLDFGFTGSIPSEIGLLTNLRSMKLIGLEYNGRLTGSIPNEITNLTHLQELDLHYNEIWGTIPMGLFSLKLEKVDLSINRISGSLPTEIFLSTSLKTLKVAGNEFSGTLSNAYFQQNSVIEILDLSYNDFSWTIPSEIGLMTNLKALDLSGNLLSRKIPSSIGALSRLELLEISYTELTGPLPSEIGAMTSLDWFVVLRNKLTGHLPSEIGMLTNIRWFEVSHNSLSGPIPSEIGTMASLRYFYVQSNRFTGLIPSEIGTMASLGYFYVESNRFTGLIPSAIGMLTGLERIDLSNNFLEGPIPSELGRVSSLAEITLYSNRLVGPLPTELGLLTNLGTLSVTGNDINGTVPTSICEAFMISGAAIDIDCDMVICACCVYCPLPPQTSSPTISVEPTITPTRSVLPTLSLVPTVQVLTVSIVILFDYRVPAKQWSLTCNGIIVKSVDYGEDYGPYVDQFANQLFEDTFKITIGSTCTFFISSSDSNGLCCEYGQGYYKILIDNQVIVDGDGNFGSDDKVTFIVDYPPPTDHPSLAPTITIAPTNALIYISININSSGGEIGWDLNCNNILIASVPLGVKMVDISDEFFSIKLPVQNGALCNFNIIDVMEISHYQILLGNNPTGISTTLIKDGFDFGSTDEYIFIASM